MRLIFRILSAFLLTIAVALVLLTFLPGQKLAELAGQQIEKQTGRQVVFGGDVRFSFWPTLGIQADNVAFANADWAGPEPMLTAGRLTIGVDAARLIRGDVRVTELTAIVPHLNLETRADGTGNWVFEPAEGAAGGAAAEGAGDAQASFAIEAISLSGASLRYAPYGQEPVEMDQLDLNLLWPEPTGTATVDLTLRPAGSPLRVQGEVGQFARFLGGEVASVGLTMTAAASKLRLDGRADLTGAFDGRVTGASEDTRALMTALGQAPVEIPRGLGQAVQVAADTTYTPDGKLALRDLSLTLDHNTLGGEADLTLGSAPMRVTAALRADVLDLSALDAPQPGAAGGGAAGAGAQGWSSDPIDASALGLLDGQIGLDVQGLKTTALTLGPSRLNLVIDRSRAVLSLLPVQAFGGSLQGELIANNRNGLSVAGRLSFADVKMQEALGQLAGYDKLTGEALGSLEFLGVGNSMDQIMRSLDGKGTLEIGKGFFTGFDLQSIMDPDGGNGGTTVFDGLTASFNIADGTLTNQDFLATLEALKAEGEGRVGIGAQDLDYTFTPTAFASETSAGVSVPVRISGSWFDPKIKPDLSKLVEPQLEDAEEKAKQAVKDKLSEELGVPVETEEDLNDALKRRVEEEAREQLLKFLGGN
ncbi:AsmA family protein [Epibacterium sp. Ofav1-8]|uniref:AsmA family protein n=1 Tax=Epibacterium sp. Ofav1-8 TaxID=2917735 RepID=UPI001EF4421B|nr:AsmA-like C-terminal region-containing protein [Epibacterium sp. Ofav1-8]MCG7622907.1 AsmA family protein [Epibacterium sp. Ofav1-8]